MRWARAVALRAMTGYPRHYLEDGVQDGMVALVECAHRYRPDGGATFRTYAGPRIRGAIIDGLRRRIDYRRQGEVGLVSMETFDRPDELARVPDLALEAVEGWDDRQRLAAAVHRLSPRPRLMVTLYYWEGLPYRQIGDLFGITESGAKLAIDAAERRLRLLLEHTPTGHLKKPA